MKRLIKWISIILVIFLIFIVITYFIISSLLDTEPIVNSNSYLYISLFGEIPEYIPYEGFEGIIESSDLDMHSIRNSLKMAAIDERIKAVVLRINPLLIGFAKIQELQQSIKNFRRSGKKVFAYFDLVTTKEYYLASACDSIFCAPEGLLLLTGVRAELTFYKDLFKLIGVEADFEHIGKYKSAPDAYMRQSMSKEQKEVVNNIIDYRYEEIVSAISKVRDIEINNIKYTINKVSGLTPDEALDLNFIDGQKYFNEVIELISSENKLRKISISDYSRVSPTSLGLERGSKIAIIYGSGTITGGSDNNDAFLGQTLGSSRLIRNIRSAADRNSIKAIVLRINSPGGSGIASDDILNALNYAREKKPVIASISDLGASGGYYIAIGADSIVCQPASLVGSIGVFAGKFSFENLYKKLGINTETIQKGENASLFALNRKFNKSERKIIQKIIKDFYKNFVQKVSDRRSMTFKQADKISQGRVWTGDDGYNIGLIDTLGGLNTALELAKSMAGIDRLEDPTIVVYPRKKSVLSQLIKNFTLVKNIKEIVILNEAKKVMQDFELIPLALMPFKLELQ